MEDTESDTSKGRGQLVETKDKIEDQESCQWVGRGANTIQAHPHYMAISRLVNAWSGVGGICRTAGSHSTTMSQNPSTYTQFADDNLEYGGKCFTGKRRNHYSTPSSTAELVYTMTIPTIASASRVSMQNVPGA
jgi:hypothetical protein